MSDRLFLFVQFEFPWELGPPDGRYLMRAHEGSTPSAWSCSARSARSVARPRAGSC